MTNLSGEYTVQQKSSQRFLDAHEASKNNFSAVTRKSQNNNSQVWKFSSVGKDTYTVQQKVNGRFLDAHEKTKDFSAVTRPKQNNDSQKWIAKHLGGDNFTLQQKNTGRFLDAHQRSEKDFDAVTRPAQNNDTQIWSIIDKTSATRRVKLRLMDVKCHTTEDDGFFGSHDELSVFWGGLFGGKAISGQWRLKAIDDGDTIGFPRDKSVVFDDDINITDPVELLVSLWDRDHGEGAQVYKDALDKTLGITATGAAAAGGPVGTAVASIAGVAKAIDVPGIVASIATVVDPDDFLGQKTLEKTVSGLPLGSEDHLLKFNKSGARYTVRIRTEVSS